MTEKNGLDILLEYIPNLKNPKKIIILYITQLMFFILLMFIYWFVSSKVWYGAILIQTIISSVLSIYYILLANNAEKIRKRCLEKYQNFAGQKFWFHYQFYTFPIVTAAYYFPLILYNYDFLPSIVNMPEHIVTNSLFPFYISIPSGVLIVFFGYLIKRRSLEHYGADVDTYIYMIYPEKSSLITSGMFKYIRNPHYVSRGIMSIGFGVLANNISAMIIGLIHLLSYLAIIPAEDRGLMRRFGDDFKKYKNEVPAIIPKGRNLLNFMNKVFTNNDNKK